MTCQPSRFPSDAFTDPIAYVWQSAAGAIAVIGSNIVRAEMCSDVEGSKSITLPWELPSTYQHLFSLSYFTGLPNATFPFFIHAATRIGSYEAKRAISSPENRSHTIAVWLAS